MKKLILTLCLTLVFATAQGPNGSTYTLLKSKNLVSMKKLSLADLPGLKKMPVGGVVQVAWQSYDKYGNKVRAENSPFNVTVSDEVAALADMQKKLADLQADIDAQKKYIADLQAAKP